MIARIAFAYSLSTGRKLSLSDIADSQGKEYSKTVLFGSNYSFYLGLICVHYGLYKTDKDIPKYIKMHINNEYKYYNFKFEEKKNTELLINNTLFLIKKDGKYGYTDKNGNIVVECKYDDATEQNEFGYASVKVNNLWGAIDYQGKIIVEPKYSLSNNLVVDFINSWHLGEDLNMNYYTDEI